MNKILKWHLEMFLEKISLEELSGGGKKHRSLADGKEYISYAASLQSNLPEFYKVCDIIRELHLLFKDIETSRGIKEKINKIFFEMDPRDAHYKNGTDCSCNLCNRSIKYLLNAAILTPENLN